MPSLKQQAERARRAIKNGLRQHPDYGSTWPFPMERNIIVLWEMHRGLGLYAIARDVGCSTSTVWAVRDRFYKDLSEIFRCPVLSGILRAGEVVRECEVCGLPMPGSTESKARTHVARHFLPEESIQLNGVMPKSNR